MQFSQYRTYKPYPYRVSKYSTFEWDVIEMPQSSEQHLTQIIIFNDGDVDAN